MPIMVMRAFGNSVALEAPAAGARMATRSLPPDYRAAPGAEPRRTWRIRRSGPGWESSVEGEVITGGTDLDAAVGAALSDMELWVAEHARPWVFVHAGCVAFDGWAVLVPGRTMAGKTSLTAALVQAGGTYYSDEYAVLDRDGRVRPYARPLSVRPPGGGPGRPVPVEELGGRAGRGPVPVGLVAALRFDAGAGWAAEELGPGSAVLRLLDNAVAGRRRPRAVLDALAAAAGGARCIAGTRGDAAVAAARLAEMVTGPHGRPVTAAGGAGA